MRKSLSATSYKLGSSLPLDLHAYPLLPFDGVIQVQGHQGLLLILTAVGRQPQDVPPLETRPASSLWPCPGKNTSSEGPRAVLHQPKVSQLGCSPQPPPRATFLGQAPWLGTAGLPSSLETWDRTAGHHLRKASLKISHQS